MSDGADADADPAFGTRTGTPAFKKYHCLPL